MEGQDYNAIPVLYCAKCMSLKIMNDEVLGDYCPECGSTDIRETDIYSWKKLYRTRYHKDF